MVFALKKGEVDAAQDVPAAAFKDLENDEGHRRRAGPAGGLRGARVNKYAGKPPRDAKKFGSPNPALKDLRFRQAIAHAIDKQTLVSRAYGGIGTPADAIEPVRQPRVDAEDLRVAALRLRPRQGQADPRRGGLQGHERRTASATCRRRQRHRPPLPRPLRVDLLEADRAVRHRLAEADRHRHEDPVVNDTQLTAIIGKGDYDMFAWGWTPFVDPDPELSYFQCDQVSKDAKDPTNYYNDANWCDPVYDALYKRQHVELDHAKRRRTLVHQMLTRFYRSAGYDVLSYSPDLQAYRTDRFTGWLHQPAKIGPVMFSNTSPTYANLKPVKPSKSGLRARLAGRELRRRFSLLAVGRGCSRGARRSAASPRLSGGAARVAGEPALRRRQGPRLARDVRLRRRLQLLPLPRRRGRPGRRRSSAAAT